jgi:hypothetical protein
MIIVLVPALGVGLDFSTTVGSSTEDDGDRYTLPSGLDRTISVEIRRFRIRLQLGSKDSDEHLPRFPSGHLPSSHY